MKLIFELNIPGFRGINDIVEAADGKFWISNVQVGYDIIDLTQKSVHRFTPEQGLLGNITISPYQDEGGLIWLSTNNGITIIDLEAGKNISFTPENEKTMCKPGTSCHFRYISDDSIRGKRNQASRLFVYRLFI